jgi:hypothetical protein
MWTYAALWLCWNAIGCSLCPKPRWVPRGGSLNHLSAAQDGSAAELWAHTLIHLPQTPPVRYEHIIRVML